MDLYWIQSSLLESLFDNSDRFLEWNSRSWTLQTSKVLNQNATNLMEAVWFNYSHARREFLENF